jgi:hypothetical protein
MSFDGYGSLMLLNITLDGNGVDSVFDEEEECILKLTYERTGGINRGWRAIQLFLQKLIYMNDFRLKCCIVEQKCKINISVNYYYIASLTLK